MSKHDLKAIKLQVNKIFSYLVEFITVGTALRYSSADIDTSHPQSLVMRQDIETVRPSIEPWTSDPTKKNEYRSHIISGIEYLFRSEVNDNSTEPTLQGDTIAAWTALGSSGVFLIWDIDTPYPIGELVRYIGLNDKVYRSKSAGAGHNPESDLSNTYWEFVGYDPEVFVSGDIYRISQIVLNEDNSFKRYISNTSSNSYPLNSQIPNPWSLIGELFNYALLPAPWSATPTPKDTIRWKPINGIPYQFASKIEGNISEPSFTSEGFAGIQAWDNKGVISYTIWSSGTTYAAGQWVIRRYSSSDQWRYYTSIAGGNVGHDPLSDPDEGGTYWKLEGFLVTPFVVGAPHKKKDLIDNGAGGVFVSAIPNNIYDLTELAPPWTKINTTDPINSWSSITAYAKNRCVRRTFSDGTTTYNYVWQSIIDGNLDINPISDNGVNWRFVGKFKAAFDGLLTYSLYDVVIATPGTTSYVSNMDINNYPLDTVVAASSWLLLGPKSYTPDEPLKFVNPTLPLVYEGNYRLSFNLPAGKSIVSIERLQDGVISRTVPVSQAITTPANNPNTIIEGFDNDRPQTITIKIN